MYRVIPSPILIVATNCRWSGRHDTFDARVKNFSVCPVSPLTFQPVERVPFFPGTSHREERPWNDC